MTNNKYIYLIKVSTNIVNTLLQFQRNLFYAAGVKSWITGVDEISEGIFDTLLGMEFFPDQEVV